FFEIVEFDELNAIAAMGGFPTRYPHWRFGMEYEELEKGYEYGLQKIYELVINNEPCYAYLMKSNGMVDQKMVMAHVYGHSDFFKNNLWFSQTNRKMIDEMANHGTRIRRYIERYGETPVEDFLDTALSIENLIDYHSVYSPTRPRQKFDFGAQEEKEAQVYRLKSKEYMDRFVNPPDFLSKQKKRIDDQEKKRHRFPDDPQKDVLLFLIEHAPLENWQRDVLSIVREEAYYFAPQALTKIMNEGWACVGAETPVFTDQGLLPMREVVESPEIAVSDGAGSREVYGRNVIQDHATVQLRTRRGFELLGSDNHRVLLADGTTWRRLDELTVGDRLAVSGGAGLWPREEVRLEWAPPVRVSLEDVADRAGVSPSTVLRHRAGCRVRKLAEVEAALAVYDAEANGSLPQAVNKRSSVRIPARLDERLGAFLGYLIGDGHVSRVKRHLGLTTGDLPQARRFARLAADLFDVRPRVHRDGGRWRVLVHSENLSDFLVQGLGLTEGPSARVKRVPEAILRSPAPVVRAFLSAYFDCDGHGGRQGVILSTMSDALASQAQLLLLNFGVLTRRRRQSDGCWHVHATGSSAARFLEAVGFGLSRKQRALAAYVRDRRWFKKERWDDEVVSVEAGRADVYDISVRSTHRYAAAGLVNHNSFWHSTIMTTKILNDSEIVDYADHHSGTMGMSPGSINPYKIGIELYRDIEERWNKGRFGKEWDECDDATERRSWDKKLGGGREKIFEVRRIYNDITFLDE
ncbi:MAG: SpoVR family protein, partial [Planctomycetota bacterium]